VRSNGVGKWSFAAPPNALVPSIGKHTLAAHRRLCGAQDPAGLLSHRFGLGVVKVLERGMDALRFLLEAVSNALKSLLLNAAVAGRRANFVAFVGKLTRPRF
jgi:hypothetical protein